MHFVFVSKGMIITFGVLLVLAACASAPSGAAPTAVVIIATAVPTAPLPSSTPLPAPSSTPVPTAPPPSPLAPTAPAPSNTPAQPTATLALLEANTIPEDGEF